MDNILSIINTEISYLVSPCVCVYNSPLWILLSARGLACGLLTSNSSQVWRGVSMSEIQISMQCVLAGPIYTRWVIHAVGMCVPDDVWLLRHIVTPTCKYRTSNCPPFANSWRMPYTSLHIAFVCSVCIINWLFTCTLSTSILTLQSRHKSCIIDCLHTCTCRTCNWRFKCLWWRTSYVTGPCILIASIHACVVHVIGDWLASYDADLTSQCMQL